MPRLIDGARVSYVGDEEHDLAVGDDGVVMLAAKGGSHVRMHTGKRSGDILLITNDDLVVRSTIAEALNDSLDDGSFLDIEVRDIYDSAGEDGVVAALQRQGHLSTLAAAAEEALEEVASWVRRDPSVREAIAQLDTDEGDAVVSQITVALMREVCG